MLLRSTPARGFFGSAGRIGWCFTIGPFSDLSSGVVLGLGIGLRVGVASGVGSGVAIGDETSTRSAGVGVGIVSTVRDVQSHPE